jgi:mono/diheme cytochrome c family protein
MAMNTKYTITGFIALGLGIIFYTNYLNEEARQNQNLNTVSDTVETVKAQGTALGVVQVPDLSDRAKQGKLAFDANCASCHGANAAGQDGVAPPLVHIIYEPNHHGDASFLLAAKNGVRAHHWPFGDMPAVQNITDDSIALIVTYVRELQRANGIN